MDRKEETMADELAEAVQIIRVAYDGIEIAMKVGSDGIEAMKKVIEYKMELFNDIGKAKLYK